MHNLAYLDRRFTRDPHDLLRRLQLEGPVSRVLLWNRAPVWLVTRYNEARALLNDPRLSKNRIQALRVLPQKRDSYEADFVDNMLHKDPPDHTRLRKLVMKAFTPTRGGADASTHHRPRRRIARRHATSRRARASRPCRNVCDAPAYPSNQ